MKTRVLVIDDDGELCREGTRDIIVMDYRMPGVSGADILQAVRERPPCPRVLLVSGKPFIEKELEAAGLMPMVSAVISKPFPVDLLLEKLCALRIPHRG